MAEAPSSRNQTIETPPASGVGLGSRLWAGFLSLLFPGLGQAFRGNYGRGVQLAIVSLVAVLVFTQSIYVWPALPSGILFAAVAMLSQLFILAVACWAGINAFRSRQNSASRLRRRWLRYLTYSGFILLFGIRELALVFPHWEPFSIPSASMEPTALVGDYILAINGYYGTHLPRRGELTVFALPRDTKVDFFKRVIGLPGDRIQMKSGVLFINDAPVSREAVGLYIFAGNLRPETFHQYRETLGDGASYFVALEGDEQPLENTAPFIVPAGHYFMLGDNRDNSADSRDPDSGVGFVPVQNLKAYPAFVFFSTNGSAQWWEFWKWPQSIRWDRIGRRLN